MSLFAPLLPADIERREREHIAAVKYRIIRDRHVRALLRGGDVEHVPCSIRDEALDAIRLAYAEGLKDGRPGK